MIVEGLCFLLFFFSFLFFWGPLPFPPPVLARSSLSPLLLLGKAAFAFAHAIHGGVCKGAAFPNCKEEGGRGGWMAAADGERPKKTNGISKRPFSFYVLVLYLFLLPKATPGPDHHRRRRQLHTRHSPTATLVQNQTTNPTCEEREKRIWRLLLSLPQTMHLLFQDTFSSSRSKQSSSAANTRSTP